MEETPWSIAARILRHDWRAASVSSVVCCVELRENQSPPDGQVACCLCHVSWASSVAKSVAGDPPRVCAARMLHAAILVHDMLCCVLVVLDKYLRVAAPRHSHRAYCPAVFKSRQRGKGSHITLTGTMWGCLGGPDAVLVSAGQHSTAWHGGRVGGHNSRATSRGDHVKCEQMVRAQ